ncbi:hypothetical protein K2X30_04190 [bacterium]|jgi:hypothetical protein|nr:hypothetical protein [bacterium]
MQKQILVTLILILAPGCSLFFGNIQPTSKKADSYDVLDLTGMGWQHLASASSAKLEEGEEKETNLGSDRSYQSKKTGNTISINSTCRPSTEYNGRKTEELTKALLLGITHVNSREEQNIKISEITALQTTIHGKLSGEPVKIRTVVLKKQECVYDLMYISRPEKFNTELPTFTQFVSSLRLH